MCGFSSYFHFNNQNNTYSDLDLDSSLQNIHHRGPDSRGKFISPDHRCALGHVRLSIIDLNGGQQPLSSESGNIQAVVNGELYDFERTRTELQEQGHNFKTKSDSEIALHLYEEFGLSFVEHLRGEFAVNIWDANRRRFIAVRDRFGIKPVYYTIVNNTLLVASEMKAFLPLGWKPEWDLDSILNNGSLFDNRTCFKRVYKLPAAHYLVATSSGSIEVRPYWDADYPDKNMKETRTVEEMVEGVRSRLIESIEQRLVADVPVGVYLSGGIDSSCIAGIASKLLKEKNPNAKIAAFSISFSEDEKFDEAHIAERTAKFCGVDFNKLPVSEDDLVNNFEEFLWHVEQPSFNLNGVAKFLLSKFVRDHGYKVVLTGEGADEHFAGYDLFHGDYLREPDNSSPDGFAVSSEPERKKRCINWKTEKFSKYSGKDNFLEKVIGGDNNSVSRKMLNNNNSHLIMGHGLSVESKYYSHGALDRCGKPNPGLALAESIGGLARKKISSKWHPLHSALYVESHTFLPNYLCNTLGDRSEMAHSIEARTPFLDHYLCEYVNTLPPSLKIKSEEDGTLNEKWILKEAVKPFITEELYNRTKHPFVAPSSKGRSEAIINLVNRLTAKEKVDRLGWIKYEKIAKARETFFKNGDPTIFKDLLILMSYIILSERFNVATFGTPVFKL